MLENIRQQLLNPNSNPNPLLEQPTAQHCFKIIVIVAGFLSIR